MLESKERWQRDESKWGLWLTWEIMEWDNTQRTDKQEAEMTEIEEAAVDDIWADSFWTCAQEENKLNEETERENGESGGCVEAQLIRLNRSVCTRRHSYNHQRPRLHSMYILSIHTIYITIHTDSRKLLYVYNPWKLENALKKESQRFSYGV